MFVVRSSLFLVLMLTTAAAAHAQSVDGFYPTTGLPFEIMRAIGDPNDTTLPFGNQDLGYNMTAKKNFRGDIVCRGGYLLSSIRVYRVSLGRGYIPTPGLRSTLRIEADSSVTEIQVGTNIEYHYDLNGRLEKIRHPNGRYIELIRNTLGNITKIIDGSGREIALTYSGNLLTSATFSTGGAISYEYVSTAQGSRISRLTNLAGDVSTMTWNDSGQMTSMIDPLVGKTEVTLSGSTATIKDSDGATILTSTFDTVTRSTTWTDGLGLGTFTRRDFRGLVISETTSRGRVTFSEYDADQNPIRIATNSDTWIMKHDTFGLMTRRNHVIGETTLWTYDTAGRVIAVTYPSGSSETFAYDSAGNVIAQKLQNGGLIRHTYDAAGNRIKTVDPDSLESLFEYNSIGFVTVQKPCDCPGSAGPTLTFTYNPAGHQISSANGVETVTIVVDTIGRALVTTFPGGERRTILWSAAPPLSISNSVSGETVTYLYGSMARLTSMVDAMGARWSFTYSSSQRSAYTSPLGDMTQYQHDSAANLAGVTWPTNPLGTPQRLYQSDSEDRLVKYTRETGDVIEFLYDSVGRQTTRKGNGATVATFAYDSQGFLTSAADPLGTASYTRNVFGQATRVSYQNGSVIDWTYSQAGRVTRIAGGGHATDIAYDSNGQLKSQSTEAGNITFNYDAATGRPSRINYPNGVVAVYSYGPTGRTSRVEYRNVGTETITFDISRDSAGRILSTWRSDLNETISISYSPRSEIIRGDIVRATDSQSHRYAYDSAGNRVKYQTNFGDTTYRYDPGNLLDTGGFDYNYNLAGEVTAIGTRNLTYDAEGRLQTDSTPQGTVTYDYDAFGNRVRSAVAGASTWRLWDEDGNEIADADPSGNITEFRYYVPGNMDALLGFTRSSQTYFTLPDPAGNVAVIVSETGAVVARYAYDAFQLRPSASFDSIDNRFRFATRREEKSGEVYVRARSLEQQTGRFMQRDPLFIGNSGDPVSWHGFIYANNDGVNKKDPTGWACIAVSTDYDQYEDSQYLVEIGFNDQLIGGDLYRITTYIEWYVLTKTSYTEYIDDGNHPNAGPCSPKFEATQEMKSRKIKVKDRIYQVPPPPPGAAVV